MTFNKMYTRVANITGINTSVDTQDLQNIKDDLNNGWRLFKNAARKYWTRVEKTADLVISQQYYALPPDCVRVTQVKVSSNGLVYPLREVASEYKWDQLNIIPALTINVPTYYFIRGKSEIGLWPIPTVNQSAGLSVSYEPRLADMSHDDVTSGTMSVTNGSATITASSGIFDSSFVGRYFQITDGTGGNWFQIASYTNSTTVVLDNDYDGLTGSGKSYTIGDVPDIPEEYHMGLVYYAAWQFFLKRKDDGMSNYYQAMFNDFLNRYKEVYSSKTTGVVTGSVDRLKYSIFTIPPPAIT